MLADPSDRYRYSSTVKRWPIILTGVVDELAKLNGENQASTEEDKARLAEGKQLIQDISGLIYELRHDRVLSPIQGQSPPLPSHRIVPFCGIGLSREKVN